MAKQETDREWRQAESLVPRSRDRSFESLDWFLRVNMDSRREDVEADIRTAIRTGVIRGRRIA